MIKVNLEEFVTQLDDLTPNQVGAVGYLFKQRCGIVASPEDLLPTLSMMFGYQGLLMEMNRLHEISQEKKR